MRGLLAEECFKISGERCDAIKESVEKGNEFV